MKITKIILTNFEQFENKTITLSNDNVITGPNKSGKTTIYNSVEFTLYGTIGGGSKIDRFILNGAEFMKVALFTDIGVVSREKSLTGSTTIKINEEKVTQDSVNSLIGAAYTEFLSATKVGYFMNLDNKAKRTILLNITKPVDKREIFNKLTGDDKLADKLNVDFSDTDKELKRIKAQHKVLETQQNMFQANRKLLNEQIVVAQDELKELTYEDPEELEIKLEEIERKRYVEDCRIVEANEDRIKTQVELENLGEPEDIYDVPSIQDAKKNIKKTKAQLAKLPNSVCGQCGQSIPSKKRESLEVQLIEIEAELGLAEENIEIEKSNKAFSKKKKELEKKLKGLKEADDTKSLELKRKWNNLNDKISSLQISNTQYEAKESEVKNLQRQLHEALESSIETDLFEYEKAYKALKPSGILVEELKLKKEELDAKTRSIYTFTFLKKNKGDGYTEVVEIRRDGIEYEQASTGEQMKYGINMARIIGKHYGIKFLFFDNASLLDDKIKPLKDEQLLVVYNEGEEFNIAN